MTHSIAGTQSASSQASITKRPALPIILSDAQHHPQLIDADYADTEAPIPCWNNRTL